MRSLRVVAVPAAVAIMLVGVVGTSYADDVSNNLDASVDAVAEVMPLTAGGSDGTTQLYVIPKNGDGKNGCNIQGGETFSVSVTSSNTAVATVSPSSLSFTSCPGTRTVTVTPQGEGSASITIAQTANNTGGTFNVRSAAFDVNVSRPPNTPPTVALAGVTGGASYNKGSVPGATCEVTDAEDGNSSFPATLSAVTGPYASDGIGQQEASCSYTDGGPGSGLTAVASQTYNIVDPTAPSIEPVLDPAAPDGNNGWYTGDVSLSWGVDEPESPNSVQKTGCVDQNITDDQAETTYDCSATSAGGSSGPVSVSVKRDATEPSVGLVGGPAHGASYYFGSVPAASTCSASDDLSGVVGVCSLSGYSAAVGSHTVTATASDEAGNNGSASSSYTVLAWNLSGFYSPVDMGGVYNTVKGGSTVPLKFELFAGPTELTGTAAVASFKTQKISCSGTSLEDPIEVTTTGGTSLRYDTTGGQFIQNWKTPTGAGTCYTATVTAADGSAATAYFKLK